MNWTDEQLAAIDFPQADGIKLPPDSRSATVTAAAGSGKTALLVERVIRILCDTHDPIPADTIAIMTFTRNAAEEFRRRMTDAVAKAAREDPQNSYLSEQLIRFRSAPISTISSFCLSIIREHAEAFGLPLSFSIIDEAKAAVMRSAALDAAMEYFYSDSFDPHSRDLLFKTFSFRNDTQLCAAVGSLHNRTGSLTDPDKWLDECVAAYSSTEAAEKRFLPYYKSYITSILERLQSNFNSCQKTVSILHPEHADRPKLEKMLLDDAAKLDEAINRYRSLPEDPTLAELYAFTSTIGLNAKGQLRFAALSCKDEYIKKRINDAAPKRVIGIRGRGLMLGFQVDGIPSTFVKAAAEKGLLILSAGTDVIRLLPPLTITKDEIDEGLEILIEVLNK